MLKPGQPAPDFNLTGHDGKEYSLSCFRGKTIILYFYPKDMTPGCTDEACQFRDQHATANARQAVIVGVSPDPPAKHQHFAEKYQLPFLLLSDTDHKTAKAYKAWGKKKLYGKEYEGVLRTTVIIDPQGIIVRVFEKVKVAGHAADVLSAIETKR